MSKAFILIPGARLPEGEAQRILSSLPEASARALSSLGEGAGQVVAQVLDAGCYRRAPHLSWLWRVITRRNSTPHEAPWRWLSLGGREQAPELWCLTPLSLENGHVLAERPELEEREFMELTFAIEPVFLKAGLRVQIWDTSWFLTRREDWAVTTAPAMALPGLMLDEAPVEGEAAEEVKGLLRDTLKDQTAATATSVGGKATASADDLAANAPAGSKITVGTKTVTLIKDDGAKGGTAGDGIDDNDTSVITKAKAYELAAKELLAANQIGDTEGTAKVGVGAVNTPVDLTNGTGTFKIQTGSAKVANTLSFSLHVGADADMTNKITVDIDTMNSANLGIKGLNVTDKNGTAATYAIDAISDAISKVSSQRSALGAVQNRLEHTIDNLDNISENTSSAESRIRDTDMAKEMVNYSKNNILAQAGQSMLAQANQSNQGVLSLLQ